MTSNVLQKLLPSRRPGVVTAVLVLVAVALALSPVAWIAPARKLVHEALRPGQRCMVAARSQVGALAGRIRPVFEDAQRLAKAESDLNALAEENQRLKGALVALEAARNRPKQPAATGVTATEPLMLASLIETRVLGRQARAYLESRGIVEAGQSDGVKSGDLVIDPAVTFVDSGRDLGVGSGDYVLAGRRIWGKIVDVSRHTGTVRRVHATGYRDLVQLAHQDKDGLKLGPRGILEGTGSGLCQVRFVETSEPISVGDLVYAAAHDGPPDEPLLYGTVVRVERSTEAAHWEVWMEPAAGRPLPNRLAVLRSAVNPHRLAGGASVVGVVAPQVETARHAADVIEKR